MGWPILDSDRSSSKLGDPHHVADQVVPGDLQPAVVAPLGRIADVRPELGQLVQRLFLGLLGHPVQVDDGAPVGLDQVGHQGVHPLLGRPRRSAARRRPGPPPRRASPRPAPRPASSARAAPACRPGRSRRSRSSRPRTHWTGTATSELITRHRAQARQAGSRSSVSSAETSAKNEGCMATSSDIAVSSIPAPARNSRQCSPGAVVSELVQRHQVVHLPQVPAADLVPVGRRDLGLQLEDLLRLGRPDRSTPASSNEDHVVAVVLADRGVLGQPVVRLVRQPEPALAGEHHVAVRVARVGLGVHADQPVDPAAGRTGRAAGPARHRGDRIDRGEQRGQRRGARASTASASMKLAYRSAILASSDPGAPSSSVVMMSRTASSAWSRSFMNAPASGLSAGISAVLSHAPLTCRNRSSWTRTSGSKAEKSSGGAGWGTESPGHASTARRRRRRSLRSRDLIKSAAQTLRASGP